MTYLDRPDLDLSDLDLAARMLASSREVDALLAIRVLEEVLNREAGPLADPARQLLARATRAELQSVRRRAFQVLVPSEKESRFKDVVRRFLERDDDLLDAQTRLAVSDQTLSAGKVETFIELTHQACSAEVGESGPRRARDLLRFLAAYGAAHPVSYRRVPAGGRVPVLLGGLHRPERHRAERRPSRLAGFVARQVGVPHRGADAIPRLL